MPWEASLHDEFEPEFDALSEDVQNEILAHARLREESGPQLGRPKVDTLNGSKHANMKELRFDADNGVWRIAFAVIRTGGLSCLSAEINLEVAPNASTNSS